MASAQIIIQQGGVASAPGVSADTLVLGSAVTLSNSSAGNIGATSWRWSLVGVPLNSAAMLANAQSAVASFTPDVPGTYMVRLDVNGGAATGERQLRLAVVRTEIGGGLLAPVSVRVPGPGEGAEANWGGNTTGWWADFAALLQAAAVAYSEADMAKADVAQLLVDMATTQSDILVLQGDVGTLQADVAALQSPPAPTIVSGVAVNPATANPAFSTLTDMSLIVSAGADAEFTTIMRLNPSISGEVVSGEVAFAIDGVVEGLVVPFTYEADTIGGVSPGLVDVQVSIPRHRVSGGGTLSVQWRATSGTIVAVGTARQIRVDP